VAYKLIQHDAIINKKIQLFMMQDLKISVSQTQKLLAKNRVFDKNMNYLKNGQFIEENTIFISTFIPNTRNLKPIFENDFFAVFDKSSGTLCHPNSKDTDYSLIDEVIYLYGKNASLVHRLDKDTSGLVIVSKDKKSDLELKSLFENRKIVKKYQAIVNGKIDRPIIINESILNSNGKIRIKMQVNKDGKKSITKIKPIKYDNKINQTLIEIIPLTGRQHQIRVHLDFLGHNIIGDTLYGVNEDIAIQYLEKKLQPKQRLMLHAFYLEFVFNNQIFKIKSSNSLDFSLINNT
jgi:23S rRNA pseudouridine1911/1915/1917 synthase